MLTPSFLCFLLPFLFVGCSSHVPNPVLSGGNLLSGTVSLATFNNSVLSYANGYDEHTERECEEVGSEGMTFLACVLDS
ncbi:hypothetical protein PIB30_097403, partial [Stylosanthes scabra]|nr:hypothetical protein [Stylosanthes scabra]